MHWQSHSAIRACVCAHRPFYGRNQSSLSSLSGFAYSARVSLPVGKDIESICGKCGDVWHVVVAKMGEQIAKVQCKQCGATWPDYEEKMTDVNIAVQLLADAFEDRFDTAIIVSGDSDLTTPIQQVRQRFPNKRLIVAFPPNRHSEQLKKVAHGHLTVGEDKLKRSQLPDPVITASGYPLQRPAYWN